MNNKILSVLIIILLLSQSSCFIIEETLKIMEKQKEISKEVEKMTGIRPSIMWGKVEDSDIRIIQFTYKSSDIINKDISELEKVGEIIIKKYFTKEDEKFDKLIISIEKKL